jgi:hypothetical protein
VIQIIARILYSPGSLTVDLPPTFDVPMKVFSDKLRGGPAVIQLKKWYKSRTTGWKSQNAHINGHVQQIAEETGNDFDTVKVYGKTEAIGAGWPYDLIGDIVVPWSEARVDTVQAAILIDTLHRLAAEYGINLVEES